MTKSYHAQVTRDGKWWMVSIPEIDGLTQARRLAEASGMAREYIALTLDVPVAEVAVTVSVADIDDLHIDATLAGIRSARDTAAALEADARRQTEALARGLAAAHVPVRDIGTLMGISFQRAHQLVIAAH